MYDAETKCIATPCQVRQLGCEGGGTAYKNKAADAGLRPPASQSLCLNGLLALGAKKWAASGLHSHGAACARQAFHLRRIIVDLLDGRRPAVGCGCPGLLGSAIQLVIATCDGLVVLQGAVQCAGHPSDHERVAPRHVRDGLIGDDLVQLVVVVPASGTAAAGQETRAPRQPVAAHCSLYLG